MNDEIPTETIKQAYIVAADVVRLHGPMYLPIFERLETEYKDRIDNKDLLTRAIKVSTDRDVI